MESIFIKLLGIAAGILTSVSFVPQLWKTMKLKSADDVSFFMLIVRGTGLALWVVYGGMRDDIVVILTFAFSFVINTAVIVLKIKYARKEKKKKFR
jgi:MtN3 and saliva related transmembrane protein